MTVEPSVDKVPVGPPPTASVPRYKTSPESAQMSTAKPHCRGGSKSTGLKMKTAIFSKDVIALADEKVQGEPLLVKVMEKGEIIYDLPALEKIRVTAAENMARLPEKYKKLKNAPAYPVELSQELESLILKLKRQLKKTELNFS